MQGLIVRAFDKDLIYDDLLGTAVSDGNGHFEMMYRGSDFRELFEKMPDIYLSIYAPPCRLLMDTRQSVRWGASASEYFEIQIARDLLGAASPGRRKRQVEGGLRLSPREVIIEKRGGFDVPRLPGFATGGGRVGTPDVPSQAQYVVLPRGAQVLSLKVDPGEPLRIGERVNPLPVQISPPDVDTGRSRFPNGLQPSAAHAVFTPLDASFLRVDCSEKHELARLGRVEEWGGVQIVTVNVQPMQFDTRAQTYLLYPKLRYTIEYEPAPNPAELDRVRQGALRAEQLSLVLDQQQVFSTGDLSLDHEQLFVQEMVPMVILTDDFAWDETNGSGAPPTAPKSSTPLPPDAAGGGLIHHFERLAEWKTSRGLRTRVVTVSEIVGGKFGDMTNAGFALDLQEVIRNFLKFAYAQWGTLYLLIGGDVNVVPMRKLHAYATGFGAFGAWDFMRNYPEENLDFVPPRGCLVTPKETAKLHHETALGKPTRHDPLCTAQGGVRIAFHADVPTGVPPSEVPRWYFVGKNEFFKFDEGFTKLDEPEEPAGASYYIIVEGSGGLINDDYYWVLPDRMIPTDFYYSSVAGPEYSESQHDFDANGNGIPGQLRYDAKLMDEVPNDGFNLTPDIWVGRAPVKTGGEVEGFVNKVLHYETLGPAAKPYIDSAIYVADYWLHQYKFEQTKSASPPDKPESAPENFFSHKDGAQITRIQISKDANPYSLAGSLAMVSNADGSEVPNYRLVARFSTTSELVIPYHNQASTGSVQWFFMENFEEDAKKTEVPTRFIQVEGPESDIVPDKFFWDPIGFESATAKKEKIREEILNLFPNVDSVQRHYRDHFDFPENSDPIVIPLEAGQVRAALNGGCHFLTLSGHGGSAGCCDISVSLDPDFSNAGKYFIAFAQSCSTASPDKGADSLGERSVTDSNGGAIGYVGYSRTSFSFGYEEFFWCALKQFRRLGPAAGLRKSTLGKHWIWLMYGQILYGDPEMPIWSGVPFIYQVSAPKTVEKGTKVEVVVRKSSSGNLLSGHNVTLLAGWNGSGTSPKLFKTKKTNAQGKATFSVAKSLTAGEIKLTVSPPIDPLEENFQPLTQIIKVTG